MEIKVNLAEIFDETGEGYSIEEVIKREVIRSITSTIKDGIEKQIKAEVSRVIDETLAETAKGLLPSLVNDLLNAEYFRVGRYGDREKEPTTFRKELIKVVTEQMVYKKTTYAGDRNVFTKAVDDVIAENTKLFQKEFNSIVNADFAKATLEYAISELKKKFGFK